MSGKGSEWTDRNGNVEGWGKVNMGKEQWEMGRFRAKDLGTYISQENGEWRIDTGSKASSQKEAGEEIIVRG